MPPHDCEGYIGPLFFRTDDGEYVPFPGVQAMTLPKVDDPRYKEATMIQNVVDDTVMTFTVTCRSARRFYKMLRADINNARRRRRRWKRWKEKVRRNTLKYGR